MVGVSKQATENKPVRMFVALDLPEMVREDIGAWGEKELGDPALRRVEGLEDRLGRILAFEGFYKSEKRPYWPHVTVARVRAEGGGSGRPMQVEIPTGPSPTKRIGWFDAVRISLYRSELQLRGARYVPLAQVELPGLGQQ